ncbi:HTTM domain-containing protein [Antrihabitans sp. YC2-6]|nr:HTTM domain-containing protein [Antrihabitans sp. YC2-6]MBJ8346150.1 HTTM domain-containing protein [Antrihabitans sp. YC2-6]
MTTLGLVRIAYGVLAIGWTFSLLPHLYDLFGRDGLQPQRSPVEFSWTLLSFSNSDSAILGMWFVLLAASIALAVGWHSRIAALIVFVCVLSFQRQNIYVFNSGDVLIRLEALFLFLGPCGAALSLDRRRTAGSFWSAQLRAPYALRLMQIQLSLVYVVTVHDKLTGLTWNEGSAVSYALRQADLANIAAPEWLTMNAMLMNFATWGALAIELALGILIWNRRLRPWVILAGVVLHLSILVGLAVAFFSFAIFVLYIAFIPPETAESWFHDKEARERTFARLRPWRRKSAGVEIAKKPAKKKKAVAEPEYDDDELVPTRSSHRLDNPELEEESPEEVQYPDRRSRRLARQGKIPASDFVGSAADQD